MEELARKFARYWNQQDVQGLLKLFHPNGTFYDSFWNESCEKSNLAEYWQSYFEEEPEHWSNLLHVFIVDDEHVVTHYAIHQSEDFEISEPLYEGVEFFEFRDGLIYSIRDHYIDPDPAVLKRLAHYNSSVSHSPKYAKSGLRAAQISKIQTRLLYLMEEVEIYTDPKLSLGKLALKAGCSSNDLSQVINGEFGQNFHTFVNEYRVRHAKKLLLNGIAAEADFVRDVAQLAGFASLSAFFRIFKNSCGTTPARFRSQNLVSDDSVSPQ